MIEFVTTQLAPLMRTAREDYGVDPVVFIAIYLVSVPIFYYSLFRLVRALAKRLDREIMLWSMIFLCTVVAPFVYVLFFGRNLPWWVYGLIALIVGQGVYSLIRTLRRKPEGAKPEGRQVEK
jgi:ABC-type Co2+ transport system permease subunit